MNINHNFLKDNASYLYFLENVQDDVFRWAQSNIIENIEHLLDLDITDLDLEYLLEAGDV